ncbi:MAG TPA: secretin N-terminal domain-containing protein [Thermoanaerobaculia bacterium]
MKKWALLLAALLFAVAAMAETTDLAAEPGVKLDVRTFQFKHKDAEKAAAIIKTLVSADGSVSIHPSTNTLVVTDHAANLKQIAQTLGEFDSPPKGFKVELKLVAASRSPMPQRVPDDLREISAKLGGVLRFNAFEKLGEVTASGKEGDPMLIELGPEYRANFKFGEYDPSSDSIRITEFDLGRIQGEKDALQLQSLLKTSLNLKVGQTVVVGASRVPQSNRALMLVLVASRAE